MLNIPDKYISDINKRWRGLVYPSFEVFAPYAAYVLKVDLLFYIAILRGFISKERPSNKIDLSYVYYLPFCHVFVSNDNLHNRLTNVFKRENQTFLNGNDLKSSLKSINEFYLQHKDEIEKLGTVKFTAYPPEQNESVVCQMWDKYCPKWRLNLRSHNQTENNAKDSGLLDYIKKQTFNSESIDPSTIKSSDDANFVTIKRSVPVRRGSWRILPKGIENKKSNGKNNS